MWGLRIVYVWWFLPCHTGFILTLKREAFSSHSRNNQTSTGYTRGTNAHTMSGKTETLADLTERADEITLKNRAMDEAPIGITIADLGQKDEPLIYANEGFERITGYLREETIGNNCRFLQGPDTEEEPVARMREAIETGESVQVELRNYRKDGTLFWNEVTLAPISSEIGDIRYYVGFQQDITTRKEYEKRLVEQRDNLDVLNQIVRHDIRNDLQKMHASAELLRDHVDEAGQVHLASIVDSVERVVDLTETARDVSEVMLDDGRDHEPIDLREVVVDQVGNVGDAYPEATVAVEGSIPNVTVLADETLESVFRNLLKNAIQHNRGDHPEVLVSARLEPGAVRVRVADNGPGVPDDRKTEIFGRGEKGLESEGTGIGLYLVDTLVRGYGGDVWVEDRPSDGDRPAGAAFVVELPTTG